jgi:hypothetical protein
MYNPSKLGPWACAPLLLNFDLPFRVCPHSTEIVPMAACAVRCGDHIIHLRVLVCQARRGLRLLCICVSTKCICIYCVCVYASTTCVFAIYMCIRACSSCLCNYIRALSGLFSRARKKKKKKKKPRVTSAVGAVRCVGNIGQCTYLDSPVRRGGENRLAQAACRTPWTGVFPHVWDGEIGP